jgi:hypothetical protein
MKKVLLVLIVVSCLISFFLNQPGLAFVSPADYEKIKKAKKDKAVQLEKKKEITGPVKPAPSEGFGVGFSGLSSAR